jgi:hypothetical protein
MGFWRWCINISNIRSSEKDLFISLFHSPPRTTNQCTPSKRASFAHFFPLARRGLLSLHPPSRSHKHLPRTLPIQSSILLDLQISTQKMEAKRSVPPKCRCPPIRQHGVTKQRSKGRYLHTEEHKHRIKPQSHPCLNWYSNPRSQFERAKTVHALDRAATVISLSVLKTNKRRERRTWAGKAICWITVIQ